MKKYVIHPGEVISANDGQAHYVGAWELMSLYGVDPKECVIFREGIDPGDLKNLFPRSDGDYRK